MMQQTNMVITQAFAVSNGGTVNATPVEVCTDCGGLYVKANTPLYFGPTHAH